MACASHARGPGIGRLVGAPGADPGSGSYKLPALPLSYAPRGALPGSRTRIARLGGGSPVHWARRAAGYRKAFKNAEVVASAISEKLNEWLLFKFDDSQSVFS